MNILGVRYSTSDLAINANRLAIRPPAKRAGGEREARPRCFVDDGGALLIDLRYLLSPTSSNERLVNINTEKREPHEIGKRQRW